MTEVEPSRDRVVAVTGAGTGIGRAVAMKFGALKWRVAVGGRRADKLTETAALVEQAGGKCLPHQLDVTDPASVERFFEAAEREFGTVTAVINNAATARYGPMDDFSPEEIELEIATKLIGSLYMARRGNQAMRRDGRRGDILFVTSSAGCSRGRGIRHRRRRHRCRRDPSCWLQFEITAVIPTAPTGDLPTSFEDWRTAIMQSFTDGEPAS